MKIKVSGKSRKAQTKAQTLGFIIIILVSAIAVAGIFIGTAQMWKSLSCYMGVPFRASFAPHIGNLKVPMVPIESTRITVHYDDCFSDCMSGSNGMEPMLELDCIHFCNQICPEYGLNEDPEDCSLWDINVTYNAKGTLEEEVTVSFYEKPNLGEYDLSSFGDPKFTEEFKMNPGQSVNISLIKPYINLGETIDLVPGYICEQGSDIMIKATSSGEETILEEHVPFCILPHINLTQKLPQIIVYTDEPCQCFVEETNSVGGSVIEGPYQMFASDFNKKHTKDPFAATGNYYHVYCTDRLYGLVYGRVNELWVTAT